MGANIATGLLIPVTFLCCSRGNGRHRNAEPYEGDDARENQFFEVFHVSTLTQDLGASFLAFRATELAHIQGVTTKVGAGPRGQRCSALTAPCCAGVVDVGTADWTSHRSWAAGSCGEIRCGPAELQTVIDATRIRLRTLMNDHPYEEAQLRFRLAHPRNGRWSRPKKRELQELLQSKSTAQIAEIYNVTEAAVVGRCKRFHVELPSAESRQVEAI